MDDSGTEEVLVTIARIHAGILAIVCALMGGALLCLATAWLVIKGGSQVGPHLGLLGYYFPGYSVTPVGCVLGFLYGALAGGAAGWIAGTVYNTVANRHR